MTFGEKLRHARELNGLTQDGLAEKSGVSQASISYYERNRREPSPTNIYWMAMALNITDEDYNDFW